MNEPALPLFARWTLYALGAVEGGRVRVPRDPVAAWLLRAHPDLKPSVEAPGRLARIRCTTELVDGLIAEEVDRAKKGGYSLSYWSFGAAFDARWYRMMPILAGAIRQHVEVEVPRLMRAKQRMLASSSFTNVWDSIKRKSVREEDWTISPQEGLVPLVVLQGLWWRLDEGALEALLRKIVLAAPDARILMDLPGDGAIVEGPWWPNSHLERLGFTVEVDLRLRKRFRLLTRNRVPICGGMDPLRVVKLVGPGQ